MIALDTDVLAVKYVFHSDSRYEITNKFFDTINDQTKAVTIFNLLELCGIIACAKRVQDSRTLFDTFIAAEDIVILVPAFSTMNTRDFWSTLVSESFSRIQKGMRLGDAVILWALETNESINSFITWNTKHFKDKTSFDVLTPSEYLQSIKQ